MWMYNKWFNNWLLSSWVFRFLFFSSLMSTVWSKPEQTSVPSCDPASHVMLLVTSDLRSAWVQLQAAAGFTMSENLWLWFAPTDEKSSLQKCNSINSQPDPSQENSDCSDNVLKYCKTETFCLFNKKTEMVWATCLPEMRWKVLVCCYTISQYLTRSITLN